MNLANSVPVKTPDLVSFRDAAASSVSYIVCINGQVPERYEDCSLNSHGVCEVYLTARVKLFDLFDEDTFWSTLYDFAKMMCSFYRS